MATGVGYRTPAPAIVDKRVDGLLQHPLLVANNNLWSFQLQQTLQPIVAIDDPSIKVIQVGGREPSTIELDHWAKLGRKHRQDRKNHPLRSIPAAAEGLGNTQTLGCLFPALAGTGGFTNLISQLGRQLVQIDL